MKKGYFNSPAIEIITIENDEVITCSGTQPVTPVDSLADIRDTVEKI